jgi:hypothetical protein
MTLRDEYPGLVAEMRGLAELSNDWDGEGSAKPGRVGVASTLELLSHLTETFPNIPAPDLGPCANGSIDLWWNQPTFRLLMNQHERCLSWYGECGDFTAKGEAQEGFPDFAFIATLTATDRPRGGPA